VLKDSAGRERVNSEAHPSTKFRNKVTGVGRSVGEALRAVRAEHRNLLLDISWEIVGDSKPLNDDYVGAA
jgi:hypothetical protein